MEKRVLINFAKVNDNAIIPSKNEEDAGYDIYANFDSFDRKYLVIYPNETVLVPTGIASAFSDEYYMQIQDRGSTGSKGITALAGVIDSSFRGEWFIPINNTNNDKKLIICESGFKDYLLNSDNEEVQIITENAIVYPYEKAIAQAVLLPVPKTEIKEISFEDLQKISSKRGDGSLGSSGK